MKTNPTQRSKTVETARVRLETRPDDPAKFGRRCEDAFLLQSDDGVAGCFRAPRVAADSPEKDREKAR